MPWSSRVWPAYSAFFGTSFHLDFSVIEEHRLVSESQRTISQWRDIMISEHVLAFGRVRSVHFFFHFGKILLLGATPHALHLATTGLGVLTCFLFLVLRSTSPPGAWAPRSCRPSPSFLCLP
jgi:hypothetical protein